MKVKILLPWLVKIQRILRVQNNFGHFKYTYIFPCSWPLWSRQASISEISVWTHFRLLPRSWVQRRGNKHFIQQRKCFCHFLPLFKISQGLDIQCIGWHHIIFLVASQYLVLVWRWMQAGKVRGRGMCVYMCVCTHVCMCVHLHVCVYMPVHVCRIRESWKSLLDPIKEVDGSSQKDAQQFTKSVSLSLFPRQLK